MPAPFAPSPYEHLRDAIVDGRLAPNERLVEEELAARLGTTRANVRTALARLEAQGLVIREHNRGARVRVIEIGEAIEILEVRATIEALVARRAAARAGDADRDRLRAIITHMEERVRRLRPARLLAAQRAAARSDPRHRGPYDVGESAFDTAVAGGAVSVSHDLAAGPPTAIACRTPRDRRPHLRRRSSRRRSGDAPAPRRRRARTARRRTGYTGVLAVASASVTAAKKASLPP